MAVVVVGNTVLDIVNVVDHYPSEDEEMRALRQFRRTGGNAANTACVIGLLGLPSTLVCTLPVGGEAGDALTTFQNCGVDTRGMVRSHKTTHMPTSYIILNERNGSRTIVHNRPALPELEPGEFLSVPALHGAKWVHFEGRNIDNVQVMAQEMRKRGVRYSVEVEKTRDGIEQLASGADVVFVSKAYVRAKGGKTAREGYDFLSGVVGDKTLVIVTWGEDGAWGLVGGVGVHAQASKPSGGRIVDTIGAGDTFIGAAIAWACAREIGEPWEEKTVKGLLEFACRIAAEKCGQGYGEGGLEFLLGFRNLLHL